MVSNSLGFEIKQRVMICLGTRPELIKCAPLVRHFAEIGMPAVTVNTGQHTDLLRPLLNFFGIRPDADLDTMSPGQSLNSLGARVMERLDVILAREEPDIVLVQGDTTTALMGALAAFNRKIPVAHLEAGLRSGDPMSPFPEEMNRRLVSRLASWHFAATQRNRQALLAEGVPGDQIYITGNTVVDALHQALRDTKPGPRVEALLGKLQGRRPVLLTTHRRENFGETMTQHLRLFRRFIDQNRDLAVIFPVHPNPNVRAVAQAELAGHDRIFLTDPVEYGDFVHLLSSAWLIVSDSGGIQEEATALGKPMIVLRENTERPEAVECGVARLVGESPERLAAMLEAALTDTEWFAHASRARTVFGDGRAAERIAQILFGTPAPHLNSVHA